MRPGPQRALRRTRAEYGASPPSTRLQTRRPNRYSHRDHSTGGSPVFTMRMRAGLIGLCVAAAVSVPAAAEPFYQGKRLAVLVNYAPGGPTDIEGRLFAKHIGRHIDGQPAIMVQNMDGAGGLVGTSYLGEIAPKDGSMM